MLVATGFSGPTAGHNPLYHNNGDGTFSRVSGGSVTNQIGFFAYGAWADYDNDGFLDLVVTHHGDSNDNGGKNLLFHNNGDGTLTKVTSSAVVDELIVAWAVQWADYDNDGFMDLLVTNNDHNQGNGVNSLYHNARNGTFTRVLTNVVATDRWEVGALSSARNPKETRSPKAQSWQPVRLVPNSEFGFLSVFGVRISDCRLRRPIP
ncbi:MAG: VCBS repeat-containing protein [Verrucomicrobiota bacterium]